MRKWIEDLEKEIKELKISQKNTLVRIQKFHKDLKELILLNKIKVNISSDTTFKDFFNDIEKLNNEK
jgi:hypothetical protein